RSWPARSRRSRILDTTSPLRLASPRNADRTSAEFSESRDAALGQSQGGMRLAAGLKSRPPQTKSTSICYAINRRCITNVVSSYGANPASNVRAQSLENRGSQVYDVVTSSRKRGISTGQERNSRSHNLSSGGGQR